jgi:predicted lipoprotein with Yx(FWY)xxD motif
MKNAFGLTLATAAAFLLIGAAIADVAPATRSATVTTARTGLGRVVAAQSGRTLYLFEKDTWARSSCSGLCATYWPPLLTSGEPAAIQGAKRLLLGSIRRADGTHQVTYAGHPVYYFSGDGKSGQTNGEGLQDFGGGWYALAPSGKKIDRG